MTADEWRTAPLNRDHDISVFDCGVFSLNEWLQRQALRAQEAGAARTFVWIGPASQEVKAYYSIAPTQVIRGEVSAKLAGGYSVIPAYLLARLALDKTLQGQGLGEELLHDALTQVVEAAERGGGRLVVVDAINERAARYYAKYGFKPIPGNDLRLVIKIASVRNSLGIGSLQLSSEPEVGLMSLTLTRPDGTKAPLVAGIDEMGRIAQRLLEIKQDNEAAGSTDVSIDLMKVLREVLGRDPFAT